MLAEPIEKSIKNAGFKPIANLSGHSLDKYTIHAGRTIPNMCYQPNAINFDAPRR